MVELVHIGEKDYLLYKSMPIDVCFVKGVLADESGNISLKGEANITEQLELAAAAHNSGGIVVVEVEKLVQAGTIPANEVAIHGFMVDYVVVGDPAYTRQCLAYEGYRAEMCGALKIPVGEVARAPFDVRKLIARRCAFEIQAGQLVNLGLGVPRSGGKDSGRGGLLRCHHLVHRVRSSGRRHPGRYPAGRHHQPGVHL